MKLWFLPWRRRNRVVFEVKRVQAKPGDVFVLQTEQLLSLDMVCRLKIELRNSLDRQGLLGVKFLILDRGAKLSVIGTDDAAARAKAA